MKDTIFREYDIRGIVGTELSLNNVYKLGKAIVTYLKQKHPKFSTIVVCRDGRTHSPAINEQIMRALTDYGIDVIDIGITPTPVMYFATHALSLDCGLAITASHNPKEYNGIKIWGVWGDEIQKIKKIYKTEHFLDQPISNTGSIVQKDILTQYISYLVEQFAHLKNIELNTVFDCGNGTGGIVIEPLIKAMGWKNVKVLFPEVDMTFPNHEADPTVEKNMQDVKKQLNNDTSLTLGIGFDGDCDRMNPMSKKGILVPGDKLLGIYSQPILAENPGAKIVFDVKSSSVLPLMLKKWGGVPIMSPTGHSIIKNNLKKHRAIMAGELSCHFFFNDKYFGYDDGIYAAMRLFEILNKTNKDLDDLLTLFPSTISSPEIRIACKTEQEKQDIVNHVTKIFANRTDYETITIDGVRAQTSCGWGLVRVSNTQTVISLRFESTTHEGMLHVKRDFFAALLPYFEEDTLKKAINLQ